MKLVIKPLKLRNKTIELLAIKLLFRLNCSFSLHISSLSRNPLVHSDVIYGMTSAGRKFAKDCALTQAKAKEVIKERRAALQDTVRVPSILYL